MRRGDAEQAEKLLRESLAVKPDFWITNYDLGVIHEQRHELKAAEKLLRQAASEDPTRTETHYRLAQVYKALDKRDDARRELKMVAEMHRKTHSDLILKITGKGAP